MAAAAVSATRVLFESFLSTAAVAFCVGGEREKKKKGDAEVSQLGLKENAGEIPHY